MYAIRTQNLKYVWFLYNLSFYLFYYHSPAILLTSYSEKCWKTFVLKLWNCKLYCYYYNSFKIGVFFPLNHTIFTKLLYMNKNIYCEKKVLEVCFVQIVHSIKFQHVCRFFKKSLDTFFIPINILFKTHLIDLITMQLGPFKNSLKVQYLISFHETTIWIFYLSKRCTMITRNTNLKLEFSSCSKTKNQN